MKLIRKYKFVSILLLSAGFTSCESLLDENLTDGKYTDATVFQSPILAEGVLLKAYNLMPNEYNFDDSYATDDAVTNVVTNDIISMATGGFTSRLYPLSVYEDSFNAFMQINRFIASMDKVVWAYKEPDAAERNTLYLKKLKGEAFAIRAWWGARLLQYHGGMGSNDILLGYPIVTTVITDAEAAKLPRNTYAECVKQIFADCDSAILKLPLKWTDAGLTANQKLVIGAYNMNRISGIGAMAIKSRVALLAASQAFSSQSGVTTTMAAQMAANVMKAHIGITGLDPKDLEFYKSGNVTAANLNTYREALWFTSIRATDSQREVNCFPPSLFGKAQINPSQNLIEAFGFNTGQPYSISSPSYDPANPYNNRDPRLAKYIVWHKTKIGADSVFITTGVNASGATATRTGYFMRKLLDETVSLKPGAVVGKPHSTLHLRYTEVLLNFAEAANEAGGPDFAIEGFTARQVISALRTRAGFTNPANATYLAGLNKDQLAAVIRNERRIELCFEGFRFWDIRRWNDVAKMNEAVRGVDPATFATFEVEKRIYEPYMVYPPIPYSETLIYKIIQNKGW